MLSGRSPWSKAVTSDSCFCEFLLNENYFREMLPVSEGANIILRHIFAYEPSERITIPALRKAVIDLNSFFMTDAEIASASDTVRMAAAYCGVHIRDGRVVPNATANAAVATPRPAAIDAFVECDEEEGSDSDSSSCSSLTDSEGPMTPAAYAKQLEREISEFRLQLSELNQSSQSSSEEVVGCRVTPLDVDVKVRVRIVSLEEIYAR